MSCIMVCECDVVYHGVRVCRVSWCASVMSYHVCDVSCIMCAMSCIIVCECRVCDVVYHGV